MKKIYKAILTLAAVMVFGPIVSAQDVPYLINKQYGIGYNKSIYTDPDTGEHSIRIETFATGGGERKAIPSDIVLVLDNSGSMLYSYVLDKSLYKMTLTQAEVDAPKANGGDPLLVPETQYYLGSYTFQYASNKTAVGTENTITWPTAFATENNSGDGTYTNVNCGRYAKYEGKYYRVFRKSETRDGSTWYYLCFRTEDKLMYLSGDEFTETKPTADFHKISNQTVLFRGNANKGTLLYRSRNRMEKLLESVHAFVKEIYDNNQTIAAELEAEGKVGNQIAIVAFGSNADNSITNTSPTENCQIIKAFTPVVNAQGVADTTNILNALNIMNFKGNTCIGRGMRLATDAFTNLRNLSYKYDAYEMTDASTYKYDEANHPIVNRSKVVVLFTDGTPTNESSFNSSNPYNYGSGTSTTHTKNRAIYFSNLIKKTGVGQINGKIFSVGLNPPADDENFLRHLSSNFSSSSYNSSTGAYTPTTTDKDLYYMDAGTRDLKDVFEAIASIAGGNSTVGGSSMVNIDIVSKSFQIEKKYNAEGTLAQNIKVYTAQCLGLDPVKTYTEDGVVKHYLAFAAEVPVGDRPLVPVLWTSKTNETTGAVTWTRETDVNVDGAISVSVADDPSGKNDVIKVTGFDYAKFWCGLDGVSEHSDNSEQYNRADYGDFSIGTGPYIKGYRGFKIIIEIPISLKEDAIGGPDVQTNEPGSGLYDPATDKTLIPYPVPTITIPVNLWIQKEGLKKGETASFTIQRKLANKENESDEEPQYENYTNFLIIGESNTDGTSKPVMVQLYNLDPRYYYKVLEDGWSWAYDKDPAGAPTTETEIKNPIVIKNKPKTTPLPKHAESVVNNDFGAGTAVTTSTKEHFPVTTP